MHLRLCDRFDGGFGWIARGRLPRTSHALAAGGGVWLVDPVDVPGLDAEIRSLGEPRGVIQLLDRHGRDGRALAERYEVPHLEAPFGGVVGAPFQPVRVVDVRGWREAALWWPEQRALLVADALGTLRYFRARGESIGVHPLLRLVPPRVLMRFDPEHVLCGHGEGLHGTAAAPALQSAIRGARRRAAPAFLSAVRETVRAAGRGRGPSGGA